MRADIKLWIFDRRSETFPEVNVENRLYNDKQSGKSARPPVRLSACPLFSTFAVPKMKYEKDPWHGQCPR